MITRNKGQKRLRTRGGGGRFQRSTLRNTFGLNANIHERKADGSWCGGMNPTAAGEAPPERCGHCGEPL